MTTPRFKVVGVGVDMLQLLRLWPLQKEVKGHVTCDVLPLVYRGRSQQSTAYALSSIRYYFQSLLDVVHSDAKLMTRRFGGLLTLNKNMLDRAVNQICIHFRILDDVAHAAWLF